MTVSVLWLPFVALAGAAVAYVVARFRIRPDPVAETDHRVAEIRRLCENLPFPVMLHTEAGEVLTVSRRWTETSGYARSDIPTLDDWCRRAYGEDVPGDERRAVAATAQIIPEGEYEIRTKTGERRVWNFYSRRLGQMPDGRIIVMTVAVDVTQQSAWEAALAESESKLLATGRIARVGYWEDYPLDDRTVWSSVTDEIWGRQDPAREITYGEIFGFHHPADRAAVQAAFEASQPHGSLEYRIIRPDGEVRWIYSEWQNKFDDKGRIVERFGVSQDVSERKRAEIARRETEARYEAIVEQQSDLIRRCTPDLVRTFVNQGYCRYFQMPRERLIGHPLGSRGLVVDLDEYVEHLGQLGPKTPLREKEVRVQLPDGSMRWLHWLDQAVFDDDGRMVEIQSVGRDITRQKEAELLLRERESQYRDLIEGSVQGIVIHDGFQLLFVNNAFAEMFGYDDVDELMRIGRLEPLIATHEAPRLRGLIEARLSGRALPSVFEFEGRRKDGRTVSLQVAARVVDWQGQRAVQGAVIDVTARKRAERALAEAKREAERASAAKSRFLAAASHDLRQPLQALGLFVNLLSDTEMPSGQRDLVVRIGEATGALEGLIDALLDVSKLEAGLVEARPEDVDLDEMLARLVREAQPVAAECGLTLHHVPSTLWVRSDPALLERITRNLLSNAIRHTGTGRVVVGCRRTAERVRLEVWDTGPGIPADQREMIFEAFHQLRRSAQERPGSLGLGLAIVQRLANLLGHRVGVRSEEGRGSCFHVSMARCAAPAPTVLPVATGAGRVALRSEGTPAVILVIDDERDVREGLERVLERWGYRPLVAESLDVAVDRLNDTGLEPDLVIADLRLDGQETGTDAINVLRDVYGAELPAFVITGDIEAERRIEVASRQGLKVLSKPISPERLADEIARYLSDSPGADVRQAIGGE